MLSSRPPTPWQLRSGRVPSCAMHVAGVTTASMSCLASWITCPHPGSPPPAVQAGGHARHAGRAAPAAARGAQRLPHRPRAAARLHGAQGLAGFGGGLAAGRGRVTRRMGRRHSCSAALQALEARAVTPACLASLAPSMLPLAQPLPSSSCLLQNKLLTDVTDGPLLRGLHLGPRPALHLQVRPGRAGCPATRLQLVSWLVCQAADALRRRGGARAPALPTCFATSQLPRAAARPAVCC